ncbi:MAG TPA: Bax inhibitor-1/YccA family protein [Candidatus Limnocylindrales bacterium]
MIVNPQSPSQLGVRPAPALVQQLLVGAFGWMFAGLLLSAGVAFLVGTSETLLTTVAQWWLPLLIGQFILVMVISAGINRLSATAALALFFVYAATMGLTIGVIVWAYLQTPGGGTAVASAFLSASAMFAGAAVYGAVTKRELAKVGGLLFMALIGLVVASIVNLFLHSSAMGWVISIVGVLIFVGLTAWDVQRITRGDYAAFTQSKEKASVLAALHLYLNFVNLFLFLLRIFGGNRN